MLDVGDVLFENIVFSHNIVYELSAPFVQHKSLPFSTGCISDRVKDYIALDLKHGENHGGD